MVRVKHRYFLVQILYPDPESAPYRSSDAQLPDVVRFQQPTPAAVDVGKILGEIRAHVVALFGEYGAAVAAQQLSMKYFSPATSTFILRCPRAQFRLVWAALAMLSSLRVPGQGRNHLSCVLRVVRVSGTIRKVEEAAVKEAKRAIARAKSEKGEPDLIEALIPKDVQQTAGLEIMAESESDNDEDDAVLTDDD